MLLCVGHRFCETTIKQFGTDLDALVLIFEVYTKHPRKYLRQLCERCLLLTLSWERVSDLVALLSTGHASQDEMQQVKWLYVRLHL